MPRRICALRAVWARSAVISSSWRGSLSGARCRSDGLGGSSQLAPRSLSAWIHRPDCARKRVVTAEMPFDLGECGLLKLAAPGSKGHLWDAIVAYRGHDARQV